MPKSSVTYWNPPSSEASDRWTPVEGLQGTLYDTAFGLESTAGDHVSGPPGERHGPFRTPDGCIVFEVSYRSQA